MFLSSNNKINITLCGMMGSGKTIVGKKLAKKIGFNFIDTDQLVEDKAGKSINDIFYENGESYFRKLEEEIIINILSKKKCVISLGGGAIMNINIRNLIINNSFNIYLDVDIEILLKRLTNSKKRPLIKSKNKKEILNELIKKRKKIYQKADLIIKNNFSPNEIIDNIIEKLW